MYCPRYATVNDDQLGRQGNRRLIDEMDDETREYADWKGGYEAIVKIAREAIESPNSKHKNRRQPEG